MCYRIDPWISSRYAHPPECSHNQVIDILHDIESLTIPNITQENNKTTQQKASKAHNPHASQSTDDLRSNLHDQSPYQFQHTLHLNEFNSKE